MEEGYYVEGFVLVVVSWWLDGLDGARGMLTRRNIVTVWLFFVILWWLCFVDRCFVCLYL